MKKSKLSLLVAVAVTCSIMFSSCLGSFSLTNKLYSWNKSVGDKWVNELVFLVCYVVPVYGVAVWIDAVILNSVEFWTGSNPVAANTQEFDTENGKVIVQSDESGYTITNEKTEASVRFNYNEETQTWSVANEEGSMDMFTFVGENQVRMANTNQLVDLSQDGVMAYKAEVLSGLFSASK